MDSPKDLTIAELCQRFAREVERLGPLDLDGAMIPSGPPSVLELSIGFLLGAAFVAIAIAVFVALLILLL